MVNSTNKDKAEFQERVSVVLHEAREASRCASSKFATSTKEAFIETSGSAVLWIYKPSYRLREALKKLNAIDRWMDGQWAIKADVIEEKFKPLSGATLREVACRAALEVFEREFPDEGRYSIRSWIN